MTSGGAEGRAIARRRTFPRAELGAVLASHKAEGDVEELRSCGARPAGALHKGEHVLEMLLLTPVNEV